MTGRHDIAEAADRMSWKLGSRREIKKLTKHLHEGENVVEMAAGQYDDGVGLLVLTNQRLLFLREGWTGAAHEDFALERVTTVGFSSSFGYGKVAIHASGNTCEIKRMRSDDGRRLTDAARRRLETTSPTAPPAPSDPLDQLSKLGELKDAGVISGDDFEAKKRELLARLS